MFCSVLSFKTASLGQDNGDDDDEESINLIEQLMFWGRTCRASLLTTTKNRDDDR